MNERKSFLFAALAADLAASVFLFTHAPQSPLCLMYSNVGVYTVTHLLMAVALWAIVGAGGWLFFGPVLVRERQYYSTKFQFLGILSFIGVVVDAMVSLYQMSGVPEQVAAASQATMWSGIGEREICYLATFWGVVALSYLAGKLRTPGETPPPRFGRD